MSEFNDELIAYLHRTLCHTVPPPKPWPGPPTWVMSQEWLDEIRALTDSAGRPLWEPSPGVADPEYLFGNPIEVREDGGAPHIEFKVTGNK